VAKRARGVYTLKQLFTVQILGSITIKTLTIKREAGRFYACFSVECEVKPLPESNKSVGIDVGLSTFAMLSDGTAVDNPRYYKESQAKLRRAQRKVARRKKGSRRRRKAIHELQRAHAHIKNQRANFHHQESRKIVNRYGLIAVEELNVKGLASGMLAKSVTDAGWSSFIAKLLYKAENAGRELIKVDPRGTSQRCICGADVPKALTERWHECQRCGLSVSRDHASALEILRLGLAYIKEPRAGQVGTQTDPQRTRLGPCPRWGPLGDAAANAASLQALTCPGRESVA
jgi:putative transposase